MVPQMINNYILMSTVIHWLATSMLKNLKLKMSLIAISLLQLEINWINRQLLGSRILK